jgi:phosphate transport system ATP-binding protein
LQRASLEVPGGSLMTVVGPSGCGKSSLLRCINRLSDTLPHCEVRGEILLGSEDILQIGTDVGRLRRRVGMVFQQPNPFPLSIADNIRFPLREHGIRGREELSCRVEKNLRDVGLWAEVKDRLGQSALSLSGGQQQRLCLARTLALEPQVLLLDEPCSALDPIATEHIEQLIQRLKGRYTILMVTHNLAQARRLADHVTVCWVDDHCGCVVESGSREGIFVNSSHPITQAYCSGDKG